MKDGGSLCPLATCLLALSCLLRSIQVCLFVEHLTCASHLTDTVRAHGVCVCVCIHVYYIYILLIAVEDDVFFG